MHIYVFKQVNYFQSSGELLASAQNLQNISYCQTQLQV